MTCPKPKSVLLKRVKRSLAGILFAIGSFLMLQAFAGAEVPLEYKIKATFIYKFINFIEWPEQSWDKNNEPMVIGVSGNTPIWEALKPFENKKNRGLQVRVRQIRKPEDFKSAHMVFISPKNDPSPEDIVQTLKGSSVLTISESEQFAVEGGMINFILVDKKVRFEINEEAVKKAGLKVSSKILRLAKIVQTRSSGGNN